MLEVGVSGAIIGFSDPVMGLMTLEYDFHWVL